MSRRFLTLQTWVDAALGEMIPAVQTRLIAEYHSHVQGLVDEGATEMEAVASLGDPAVVAKGLKRTYFTRDQLSRLRTASKQIYFAMIYMLIASVVFIILSFSSYSSNVAVYNVIGYSIALTFAGLLWWVTRQLPIEMQSFFRAALLSLCYLSGIWIGQLFMFFAGDPAYSSPFSLFGVIFIASSLLVIPLTCRYGFLRLRRTLHAERASTLST